MTHFEVKSLYYLQLENINLSLTSEKFTCLSGESGTGKSLLLKCLVDLVPHQSAIFLNGRSKDAFTAPQWRQKIGLLPSEPAWWADTVAEHFEQINLKDFTKLGFTEDVLEWKVSRLSSGERQRLSLLRLLSNKPSVLLLDEPTANLDPQNTLNVETLVKSYQQENDSIVLWISHDPEQVKRISNQSFILNKTGLEVQST